jgi:hypothetical protein
MMNCGRDGRISPENRMSVDSTRLRNPQELALLLERQINRQACGRISQLSVETRSGTIFVSGRSPTYYIKQLAILAVHEVLGDDEAAPPVRMDIQVGSIASPLSRERGFQLT